MKSKNIDDILNEMRNRADTVIEGRTLTERNFVPQEKIDEWADQIELAVKHMHGLAQAHCNMLAKAVKYHKDKHIGNAAAMRKALDCALAVLDGFGYARPDCVRAAYDCKTALAAPPRNCDRFATWEDALSAFREATGNRKPLELWLKSEIQAFAIWLFALATEKEGGAE